LQIGGNGNLEWAYWGKGTYGYIDRPYGFKPGPGPFPSSSGWFVPSSDVAGETFTHNGVTWTFPDQKEGTKDVLYAAPIPGFNYYYMPGRVFNEVRGFSRIFDQPGDWARVETGGVPRTSQRNNVPYGSAWYFDDATRQLVIHAIGDTSQGPVNMEQAGAQFPGGRMDESVTINWGIGGWNGDPDHPTDTPTDTDKKGNTGTSGIRIRAYTPGRSGQTNN
jgi:hypothetical protein